MEHQMTAATATTDTLTTGIESPFLTEQEAAMRLKLTAKTLRNWRSAVTGPGYLKFGSAVRYDMTTLDSWALAQAA